MPSTHRIRLRGPWEYCFWNRIPEPPREELKRGRIKLPTTWREAFGDCHANVTLTRSFGHPEGIKSNDAIWLELVLSRRASVKLNRYWIGTLIAGTTRIDVTLELHSRNELRLTVTGPTTDELDTTILEAALLIESKQ